MHAADIAIVIVEDHPIVRVALCQVLGEVAGLSVLSACETCHEAMAALQRFRPDILILDAGLPDQDGIAAIPAIRAISPNTDIVLFTATVDEERSIEALRLGAKAVLLKSSSAVQLIDAIRSVHSGAAWIAPDGANTLCRAINTATAATAALTNRERQIAELVARGARNKQIAWQLGVAEGTVKLHISRAFRKLRVDNRVGLSRVLGEAVAGTG
jgi:two-component system nitrate/nitrite response regulator NarL